MTFSLLTRNTILTLALALAFPTGASIIVVNEQRETPLLAPDKINKVLNVVERCGILIKCLAHLFTVTDFFDEKVFYFFDSTKSAF